jgi:hypothetical protein
MPTEGRRHVDLTEGKMNRRFNAAFASGARLASTDLDFVFVADADNLSHAPGCRGSLDIPALAGLLKSRGVTHSIIVSNWLSPIEAALWAATGAHCITVKANCDDVVTDVVRDLAALGARRVLLGSGDAGYTELVQDIRRLGIDVHLLAHSAQLARRLRDAATNYAWIDRFLWAPKAVAATRASTTVH